jgi:hypothetical protein
VAVGRGVLLGSGVSVGVGVGLANSGVAQPASRVMLSRARVARKRNLDEIMRAP